jgi:opacity protein-like surface antigen
MKISRLIVGIWALIGLGAAQAQDLQSQKPMPEQRPWSLAFAYEQLAVSEGDGSDIANMGGSRLAYRVHPNVDIEGMVATSLADVKIGGPGRGRISQSLGLFIKPGMDLGIGLRAFVRLGSVNSHAESTDSGGNKGSMTKQTRSYGIGLSYRPSKQWSVAFDYMRNAPLRDLTVHGSSLGIAYGF